MVGLDARRRTLRGTDGAGRVDWGDGSPPRYRFTFISLMLCVATIVLWLRSYSFESELYRTTFNEMSADFALGSVKGVILIVRQAPPLVQRQPHWRYVSRPVGNAVLPRESFLNRLGFSYHRITGWGRIGVPYWFVAVVFLLLPGVRLGRWCSKRFALGSGHCRVCKFNLTGNISGICPECGTGIEIHKAKNPS